MLEGLTEDDVAGIPHPDRDAVDCLGVSVFALSPFPVTDHTAYMVLSDRTEVSPSAEVYDRTFLSDPDCFRRGDCDTLETVSDIYRDTFLVSMGFTLYKDYRWVDLDGDDRAVVSRGWIAESAHDENGEYHLWQSYEIDVWLPAENGETHRLFGIWSEPDYGGLGEDVVLVAVEMGIEDSLAAQDAWLEE